MRTTSESDNEDDPGSPDPQLLDNMESEPEVTISPPTPHPLGLAHASTSGLHQQNRNQNNKSVYPIFLTSSRSQYKSQKEKAGTATLEVSNINAGNRSTNSLAEVTGTTLKAKLKPKRIDK